MNIAHCQQLTLADIAAACDGELLGDPNKTITGPASLENAGPDQLTFLVSAEKMSAACNSSPGVVLLRAQDKDLFSTNRILVADPYLAYAQISGLFVEKRASSVGIHETAIVDPTATLGSGVSIGPFSVVGPGVKLGDNVCIGAHCSLGEASELGAGTTIEDSVVIYANVRLGKDCHVSATAVIGASGFGYAPEAGSWRKIHQIGGVLIGDDVDIGAGTKIDCGTIEPTTIGDRVKLDNLIHIAHNCIIGEDTIMAAMVGIAGSSEIGKRCMIGGRASIIDHVKIVDDTVVHALAMVTRSITEPGQYSSVIPARPVDKWRRTLAHLNRLDKLVAKIKRFGQ